MTFAIGLRVYQISIDEKNSLNRSKLTDDHSQTDLLHCGREFVAKNSSAVLRSDIQRVWFLEEKSKDVRSTSGIIHYGTYGFESQLVDTKTRTSNYTRKVSDVEEIPLYFSVWVPKNKDFGFICFQSFQARSCATIVLNALKDFYEAMHGANRLRVKKIMPSDVSGSAIYSAPVKGFTYVKKKLSKDSASNYLKNVQPDEVKFEIKITARRNGVLGSLGEFMPKSKRQEKTLLTHDGIQFDEAKAEIVVGGRKRTVGVIGYNTDIGAIDLSDVVKKSSTGHPDFASIKKESDEILQDFYRTFTE